MSADDGDAVREQAAKKLLGGRDRIKAKAHALTPVQAARRWYSDDALEAVEAALEDDRVELTDDLLAAVREDAELDDATAAAVTGDDVDPDPDGSAGSAEILTASDYVERRNKQRERVEASRQSQTASGGAPDDVALAAMDGDDRVEASQRGQDPAEYIQAEYGLMAAEYDDPDALNAAIIDQQSADREG
jgi:hypothetical protein